METANNSTQTRDVIDVVVGKEYQVPRPGEVALLGSRQPLQITVTGEDCSMQDIVDRLNASGFADLAGKDPITAQKLLEQNSYFRAGTVPQGTILAYDRKTSEFPNVLISFI